MTISFLTMKKTLAKVFVKGGTPSILYFLTSSWVNCNPRFCCLAACWHLSNKQKNINILVGNWNDTDIWEEIANFPPYLSHGHTANLSGQIGWKSAKYILRTLMSSFSNLSMYYFQEKQWKLLRLKKPFNRIFDLGLFPSNLNSHFHFFIKNFKLNTWLQLYKITGEIISVYTWNTWTPFRANQSKKNMNLNLWIPNFELWLCTCYNLALSKQAQ